MRNLVWVFIALLSTAASAQTDTLQILNSHNFTTTDLSRIGKSYDKITVSLKQKSLFLLTRMQQEELNLHRKIPQNDSLALKAPFQEAQACYQLWRMKLMTSVDLHSKNPLREYIPRLDSLQTALNFLREQGVTSLPTTKLNQIQGLSQHITAIETRLQQAQDINNFLKSRKEQLQAQLQKYNMTDKLNTLKRQVYYYQQSIQQYKAMIYDRDKIAVKVIGIATQMPAFSGFMQKHSYLSQLFRSPGSGGQDTATGLPGLQTKMAVASVLNNRLGSSRKGGKDSINNDGFSYLEQQSQQAVSQLNDWKQSIVKYGDNSTTTTVPGFNANPDHGKTFLKRIEYGVDFQSQGNSGLLPASTQIGLTLGYKINPAAIAGIGVAYRLGWGQPLSHMHLSNQGVGLQTFLQIRLKQNIWLSGGIECSYWSELTKIPSWKDLQAWQPSGLIGLMKKYKLGKRQGSVQILYDLLHDQHTPNSSAFIFRTGYVFP
jgi:hypothetical protein